jgi:hypothetical protein
MDRQPGWIVPQAEKALRDFGARTKADARRLLPSWVHYPEMREQDIRNLLKLFDEEGGGL